jgi:hypothetical protein
MLLGTMGFLIRPLPDDADLHRANKLRFPSEAGTDRGDHHLKLLRARRISDRSTGRLPRR